MSAGRVLLRKELLESWRTLRLPIVAGLFLLVGLSSPLLARFLPEIINAAAGDQLPAIPIPTPVPADAVDQLWKNLAPVRGARGDRAGDGLRRHGTGARHGRVPPLETRLARRVPRRQGRGPRAGACRLRRPGRRGGWFYTAILFEPLPVARLGRPGRPRLARPLGLGGHHVPRQHGHRLRRGRGRRSGSWRSSSCRSRRPCPASGGTCPAAWPGRRSRWRPGAPVDRRRCPDAGHRDGRPDRRGARSRGLVVPPPGALSAALRRSSDDPAARASPRSPSGRSRARPRIASVSSPRVGGGVRIAAGVADSCERDADLADHAPGRMLLLDGHPERDRLGRRERGRRCR